MKFKEIDKLIIANMPHEPKKYAFKITDIIEKTQLPHSAKYYEDLFLYKSIHTLKRLTLSDYETRMSYYIVDGCGNICGQIPLSITDHQSRIKMDYWLKPEFQNKGIGTIATKEIIDQIMIQGKLNNIPFIKNDIEYKSLINKIELEINDSNLPSISLAKKLGFKKEGFKYALTQKDYINLLSEQQS